MRTYRTYLNSIGRPKLPKNLRTIKRPGDIEIINDGTLDGGAHVHQEQAQ